jgi:hypothetical protein
MKSLKHPEEIVERMLRTATPSNGIVASNKDNWRARANAKPLIITRHKSK